jgi:hypothetical protein
MEIIYLALYSPTPGDLSRMLGDYSRRPEERKMGNELLGTWYLDEEIHKCCTARCDPVPL